MVRHSPRSGFTIVEMLIVVFILGILGAVVIPHVRNSSQEAKASSLRADLMVIRSAIDFYAVQHNDIFPGDISGSITWDNFVTHMVKPSNKAGLAGSDYGPYLRNGIPRNPYNNLNTGAVGVIPDVSDNTTGWYYDAKSGEFYPNHGGALMKTISEVEAALVTP